MHVVGGEEKTGMTGHPTEFAGPRVVDHTRIDPISRYDSRRCGLKSRVGESERSRDSLLKKLIQRQTTLLFHDFAKPQKADIAIDELHAGLALKLNRFQILRKPFQRNTRRQPAMMGQELLNPPSVEGWHTGREWIDSSFLIERVNYAVEMLGNPNKPGMKNILERIGSDHTSISLSDLVDTCLYELGCVELDEKTKSILLSELGQEEPIVVDANFGQRVGQVMELIVASREFQLS